MSRISPVLKSKLSFILFMMAAIAGAVLIFWYLNSGEPVGSKKETEIPEQTIEIGENQDEAAYSNKVLPDKLSNHLPSETKAVNLPINFFGDYSILHEGDSVDIISVFYNRSTDLLHAEKIISGKEIIRLESGNGSDRGNTASLSDAIFPDDISGTAATNNISSILVITFFLSDEELLKSFKALESGILYLALCSGEKGEERDY